MDKHVTHVNQLISDLAKEAGVSSEDTRKVLSKLGIDSLASNVGAILGAEGLKKITVGDLKIAAKLGRSSVAV